MKKGRFVLMLTISLAMAVGAAVLAKNWLAERMRTEEVVATSGQVVVAALEIPFGESVEAAEVKVIDMPESAVPDGSFKRVDDVVGRVATQAVLPGEILLEKRIVEHMSGSALAVVLEKGKRAITVRVDDVVGVAGFLLPGNRVDVVATRRNGGRRVDSKTILSNLKVLAVDQTASPERDGPVIVRAVTLEVNPRQAERLAKATQEGKVQLTLRNPLDKSGAELASMETPEPKAKPAPKPVQKVVYRSRPDVSITVIRGTDVSAVKVKD